MASGEGAHAMGFGATMGLAKQTPAAPSMAYSSPSRGGKHLGLGMPVPPPKKKKAKLATTPQTSKTPFSVLNEQYPILQQLLKWDQRIGPDKKPFFRCYLELNGILFNGEGASKKIAKHVMAERALAQLLQPHELLGLYKPTDRTVQANDDMDIDPPSKSKEKKQVPKPVLMLLNEKLMRKNEKAEWKIEENKEKKTFRATVTCCDASFHAEETTKDQAKRVAARKALFLALEVPEEMILMEQAAPTLRQTMDPRDAASVLIEKYSPDKSPVSMLHECAARAGLTVNWLVDTEDGKPPTPQAKFKAVVTIGDDTIEGDLGQSKKEAKLFAACAALAQVFKLAVEASGFLNASGVKEQGKKTFNVEEYTKAPAQIKPPALLLHELCAKQGSELYKLEYEFVEEQMMGKARMFVMKAKVGEKDFTGSGSSKKLAKTQAAREAIRQVFGVETPDPFQGQRLTFGLESAEISELVDPLSDAISMVARKRYLELCTEHSLSHSVHMAAFVVTIGPSAAESYVVSLGVGGKARSGLSPLSGNGLSLLDSHAVVLARRGLLLFLYSQLSIITDPQMVSHSIFEPRPGGGYRLKPNYKVHLYSTMAPSGAAAVEAVEDGAVRDLRFYKSDGVATESVKTLQVASMEGCVRCDKVMCVSDKILKWNVVGVQGALLSHYVQPIYLDRIVVGASNADRDTVLRGVWGRLVPRLAGVELPQPVVSGISIPEHVSGKPMVASGMSWSLAGPGVECLAQETGLDLTGKPSRLCKQYLFEQFGKLNDSLTPIQQQKPAWKKYGEAKQAAFAYQMAKKEFMAKCQVEDLGCWLSKPPELEQFELPWSD